MSQATMTICFVNAVYPAIECADSGLDFCGRYDLFFSVRFVGGAKIGAAGVSSIT